MYPLTSELFRSCKDEVSVMDFQLLIGRHSRPIFWGTKGNRDSVYKSLYFECQVQA